MNDNKSDLLTNEIAPKRRDELQIHNKKLGEVSNWLKSAFSENNSAPEVLYFTGPTGSGKSTSVEVICKEQNIELIDYNPELLHDDFLEYEKHDSSQLIRFLIRRHASLKGGFKKRILFVSELPDQSYQDAEKFREVMLEALCCIRHPVIFCLTNDIACWNLNPDKLFTREFIRKADISTITFNPVADTFMKKALFRANRLSPSQLSDAKLNIIKEEARGDLRAAMNILQMNSIGPNADRRTGMKLICASKANKEEAFHMLGRILYAKRVNPNAPKLTRCSQKRRSSVPIPEPTERTDLERDPSDIITMSSMNSGKLIDFLFENESVFCPNISSYRRVVDAFSFCDVLAGDWNTARAFPDEYAAQIATRSVMWNNFQGSRPKTMFRITRPAEKDLEKQMTATRNEIRRLPMIGNKHFSSLDAPYRAIIENITDPQRIESFLARPLEIGWTLGKDRIEELIDGKHYIAYKGREHPRKAQKNKTPSKKSAVVEEEEETYTIEDSSDDSFDEF